MRSLRIYSFNNFQIHYTAVNYSHVVHYIPCTYLSYKWKFVQHCKINLTLYSICCFYPFLTFLLEYNWLTMYSFRSTVKWICYTYTYVHSFLDYFPIKAITQYWAELVFILWFLLSLYCKYFLLSLGFPGGIVVKYLPAKAGDMGREEALEKEMTTHSRYSCLRNPMDRGEWWAAVHGVTKNQAHSVIKQQQHIFRYFLKTWFLNWLVFHSKNVTYLTMSNCWILNLKIFATITLYKHVYTYFVHKLLCLFP